MPQLPTQFPILLWIKKFLKFKKRIGYEASYGATQQSLRTISVFLRISFGHYFMSHKAHVAAIWFCFEWHFCKKCFFVFFKSKRSILIWRKSKIFVTASDLTMTYLITVRANGCSVRKPTLTKLNESEQGYLSSRILTHLFLCSSCNNLLSTSLSANRF